MGHHTDVLMALAELAQAARDLSTPPDERETRPVEARRAPRASRERQPQDVVMAHWLSAWLVSYWLTNGTGKRTSGGAGAAG